jgi:hypothetical protein
MSDIRDALVGQWYLRRDTGETFLVTDYDDESGTVEIQTSDGDLDELDEEAWQSLPLALAEPTQDWRGPIDAEDQDEDQEIEPAQANSSTDSREPWEDSSPATTSTSMVTLNGPLRRILIHDTPGPRRERIPSRSHERFPKRCREPYAAQQFDS